MKIDYPDFLENLLQNYKALRSAVDDTVTDFAGWLNTSEPPFFTDYTDHGLDHLNQMLLTATNLITKEAKARFTSVDATTLILATLIHDAVFHLSEAGFYSLIHGKAAHNKIAGFDDTHWSDLWDDFFFSAKRWDDRKLMQVFGTDVAGKPLISTVRDPFLDYGNLNEADHKLIGEFIRWHYPRLAHEFAVFGVPTQNDNFIKPAVKMGDDVLDIVGLVARSQGLPLRTCIDYLQQKYDKREYKGIHAVYLMVLLRLADDIQIQGTSDLAFTYRHIPSQTAQLEWQVHQSIQQITRTDDAPETIKVQASPEDVKTFLRLKDWLGGLQSELDQSWAVLGEIYGLHPRLSSLGVTLRRVRSNLDQVDEFAKAVAYVPERIELTVARPDLLKLLVGPLYDNIPSIGVRELMQNSVDAVRERWALEAKYPDLKNKQPHLLPQEHDVEIRIDDPDEDGNRWFTISDKGAGMTVQIVKDYFLTTGASFRNSDAWKKEFETDDDDQKKSSVLRSGRFGVGILAGFLLGSSMEISTRHIRSDKGVRFSTTIELEALELRYDPELPIGTTIKILISPDVHDSFKTQRVSLPADLDWFMYDQPSVSVSHLKKKDTKISTDALLNPSEWRKLHGIDTSYYVYWSFAKAPNLTVNGIFVTNSQQRLRFSGGRGQSDFPMNSFYACKHPNIAVEDSDATFPLNLRRSDIIEKGYSFEAGLQDALVDDFLAYLIVNCPESSEAQAMHDLRLPKYIGSDLGLVSLAESISDFRFAELNYSAEGMAAHGIFIQQPTSVHVLFSHPDYEPQANISRADMLVRVLETLSRNRPTTEDEDPAAIAQSLRLLNAWGLYFGLQYDYHYNDNLLSSSFPHTNVVGARLLAPASEIQKIASSDYWLSTLDEATIKAKKSTQGEATKRRPASTIERLEEICEQVIVDAEVGDYVLFKTGACEATRFNLETLSAMPAENLYVLEVFIEPKDSESDNWSRRYNKLAQRWEEVIQHPVIPFDPNARREQLSAAYDVLAPFIAAHEAMKAKAI